MSIGNGISRICDVYSNDVYDARILSVDENHTPNSVHCTSFQCVSTKFTNEACIRQAKIIE